MPGAPAKHWDQSFRDRVRVYRSPGDKHITRVEGQVIDVHPVQRRLYPAGHQLEDMKSGTFIRVIPLHMEGVNPFRGSLVDHEKAWREAFQNQSRRSVNHA